MAPDDDNDPWPSHSRRCTWERPFALEPDPESGETYPDTLVDTTAGKKTRKRNKSKKAPTTDTTFVRHNGLLVPVPRVWVILARAHCNRLGLNVSDPKQTLDVWFRAMKIDSSPTQLASTGP
jgi:hypothetical protein